MSEYFKVGDLVVYNQTFVSALVFKNSVGLILYKSDQKFWYFVLWNENIILNEPAFGLKKLK